GIGSKGVTLVQLTFVLRLVAASVKGGIDGIGIRGLQAVVCAEVAEQAVAIADVLINPSREQPFICLIASGGTELISARHASSQTSKCTAAQSRVSAGGNRGCTICARSMVIKTENLVVKRNRRGLGRGQVCQCR